ncbi:MAG TPA: hypothetical protein VKC90_03065 [Chitinophagaceae bacterium]|nr:hypothetical protein [Chitinophagaceae bacterium]
MPEYNSLELSVLVDILAEHTKHYTKMLVEGLNSGEDFEECKKRIKLIQSAIQHRIDLPPGSQEIQNAEGHSL